MSSAKIASLRAKIADALGSPTTDFTFFAVALIGLLVFYLYTKTGTPDSTKSIGFGILILVTFAVWYYSKPIF